MIGLNRGVQPVEDRTPPLPAAELDHVMACFRKLPRAGPSWHRCRCSRSFSPN